ncbi:MAG: DUF2306 domain-containing protein [Flavobacteriales bacterium]
METLFTVSLIIHIISGYLALAAGTTAIIARKGQNVHRKAGRLFVLAMLGVGASAFSMSSIKGNQFLFHIAIFTMYQVYGGWRALRQRDLRANAVDWIVASAGLINGVVMLFTGNIVLMVFGGISVLLGVGNLRTHLRVRQGKEIHRLAWLRKHIGMMMGAFIATVTAFIVVNVTNVQPGWVLWLAPTAIFMPVMQYHTRRVMRAHPGVMRTARGRA